VEELTELALRARDGDPSALEWFVRRSQADVWRLCRALVGPAAADDLTQETFARAVAALPAFRGGTARSWLLTIARRVCADEIRGRTRRRRLALAATEVVEEVPPATGAVDLELLLDAIDEDRRVAFVLTQWLGLSYAEAADVCGCPVGTIRSRLARAREDLVAAMAGEAAARTGRRAR